jgi:hypothetical protein
MELHDFGWALKQLRAGHAVEREGWNGSGLFVYLVQAGSYPAQSEAIKGKFFNNLVPYGPYLAMKTAQNNVVPWLASQTDILGEDYNTIQGD